MARVSHRTERSSPRKRSRAPAKTPGAAPDWIEPQLCRLVETAPSGPEWVHEVKFDGYRIAARVDRGQVTLLTRSGLN